MRILIFITSVLILFTLISIEIRVGFIECKISGGELIRIPHSYLDLRECKRLQ